MGGPFSAQSSNVHSVWCMYTHKHLFRILGDLRVMLEGYTYWQGHVTALCQFKDNIALGTNTPPP